MKTENDSHFRLPEGEEGREILRGMNLSHAGLTDWALEMVVDMDPADILDIGCGGGMALSKMADLFPQSQLTGVDLSPESILFSAQKNAEIKGRGRLQLKEASVCDLPFENDSFDMVTAFETYFFWPDIVSDMTQAVRVLRSGGHILVVSEIYPHPDFTERNEQCIALHGMKLLENEKMVSLLESLSVKVTFKVDEKQNWVAFLGKKNDLFKKDILRE